MESNNEHLSAIRQTVLSLTSTAHFNNCHAEIEKYIKATEDLNKQEKYQIAQDLIEDLQPLTSVQRVFLSSISFQLSPSPATIATLLRVADQSHLSFSGKWQVLIQILSKMFVNSEAISLEASISCHEYYRTFLAKLMETTSDMTPTMPLPRTHGSVVFVTGQFLGLQHAPTKGVLDLATAMMAAHDVRPFIINTATLPRTVSAPLFRPFISSHNSQLNECRNIAYAGLQIPYLQAKNPMPNGPDFAMILTEIARIQPEFVLTYGVPNYVSDLCAAFATVFAFNTSSELAPYQCAGAVLTRSITDRDRALCDALNYDLNGVLHVAPAYEMPQAQKAYSLADLGASATDFVITVVGTRLDAEISVEFLALLRNVLEAVPNAYFVFAGQYQNVERHCDVARIPRSRYHYAGYADLMGLFPICDIFLNPTRSGGGTSACQALGCGAPVVTVDYGDVASNSPHDFRLRDYAACLERVQAYVSDPDLYGRHAELARIYYAEGRSLQTVAGDMLTAFRARLC